MGREPWAMGFKGVRYAHGFLYGIDIASLIDERSAARHFYNRSLCSLAAFGGKARSAD